MTGPPEPYDDFLDYWLLDPQGQQWMERQLGRVVVVAVVGCAAAVAVTASRWLRG